MVAAGKYEPAASLLESSGGSFAQSKAAAKAQRLIYPQSSSAGLGKPRPQDLPEPAPCSDPESRDQTLTLISATSRFGIS